MLLQHCMKIRKTEATERDSLHNYLKRFAHCLLPIRKSGHRSQEAERAITSAKLSQKLKAPAVKDSRPRDKTNFMEDESNIVCKFLHFRGEGPFMSCYQSKKHKRDPKQYFSLNTLRPLLHRLGLLPPRPPAISASRKLNATAVKDSGARDKTNSMQEGSNINCKIFPFRIQGQLPLRVCYHSKPHKIQKQQPLPQILRATPVKNSGAKDKINAMDDESDIVCKLQFSHFRGRGPFRVCYHSKLHKIRKQQPLSRTPKATAVKDSRSRDKLNSIEDGFVFSLS